MVNIQCLQWFFVKMITSVHWQYPDDCIRHFSDKWSQEGESYFTGLHKKNVKKNWLWFVSNVMRSPSGSYACTMYTTNPAAAPFFTRATWLRGSKTGASSFTFFIQTCNSISSTVPSRDAVYHSVLYSTYQQKQLQTWWTDDPDGFTSQSVTTIIHYPKSYRPSSSSSCCYYYSACLISHFFSKRLL